MRQRRPPTDPPPPDPEWKRRFDAAEALLVSLPQPDWVLTRLEGLRQALAAADDAAGRLSNAIVQLQPEETTADLKRALRQRERTPSGGGADDLDRRIESIRRRYETVNDVINRRDGLRRQMLNTAADLELLAAEALRNDALGHDVAASDELDAHLRRLDDDLHALAVARREVDRL